MASAAASLDASAVGRGPAAFSGVRLAVSIAQGMALGLDLPVIPSSSLAALALDAPDNGAAVRGVIDAPMGEVYADCLSVPTMLSRVCCGRVTPVSDW